jgi:hypothetical protein
MLHKIVLLAAALVIVGCENPTTEGKSQILTTPESTPTAISSPKPKAATPTPKTSERIYIPVYQKPTPKKIPASPVSRPKQVETKPAPLTSGSTIPAQSGNCKELRARGISNIDVKANPWAKRLDRDNDGVACES